MKRYTNEVLSVTTGLSVIGATVAVFLANTSTLATLYAEDDLLSAPMLNPFSTGFLGEFEFYAADGVYDLRVTRAGRVVVLPDVELVDLTAFKNLINQIPTGPSDSAFTSLAALKAANPLVHRSPRLAAPAGSDGGVVNGNFAYQTGNFTGRTDVVFLDGVPPSTGALVRYSADSVAFLADGVGAAPIDLKNKAGQHNAVNDFGAKGDAVFDYVNNTLVSGSDDTAAINRAILAVSNRGGGEVMFGASAGLYYIRGPVLIPTNIRINMNGQTLTGRGVQFGDTMFETATIINGALVSNVAAAPETTLIPYSGIKNGQIVNCGIGFNFNDFNEGCFIRDIRFYIVRQSWKLSNCFYLQVSNVVSKGGSDVNIPTYWQASANNAMVFTRVTATTEFGFLWENTVTAAAMIGCSTEGGTRGIVVKGDVNGFAVMNHYAEALGTLFDFSQAGAAYVTISGTLLNGVGTVFDDGGVTGTGTLFGRFDVSNHPVGITPTYPGLMKISAPRNYITFESSAAADTSLAMPTNWRPSKNSDYTFRRYWNADGKVDIRAAAIVYGGLVHRAYSGNVGTPFPGTVPFSTISIPTASSVSATVTTQITLENDASVVHFIFALNEAGVVKKVSGTVYGDFVDQRQGLDRPVTLSQTGGGFIVLTIGSVANPGGNASITGTVYLGC